MAKDISFLFPFLHARVVHICIILYGVSRRDFGVLLIALANWDNLCFVSLFVFGLSGKSWRRRDDLEELIDWRWRLSRASQGKCVGEEFRTSDTIITITLFAYFS